MLDDETQKYKLLEEEYHKIYISTVKDDKLINKMSVELEEYKRSYNKLNKHKDN
jgi:hypothetical protein